MPVRKPTTRIRDDQSTRIQDRRTPQQRQADRLVAKGLAPRNPTPIVPPPRPPRGGGPALKPTTTTARAKAKGTPGPPRKRR